MVSWTMSFESFVVKHRPSRHRADGPVFGDFSGESESTTVTGLQGPRSFVKHMLARSTLRSVGPGRPRGGRPPSECTNWRDSGKPGISFFRNLVSDCSA